MRGLKVVIIIIDSKCTGCETCVNTCPASVYEIKDGKSVPVRVADCVVCRSCESQCPEGAIQVIEKEIEPPKLEKANRKVKKNTKRSTKSEKKKYK